ncbi:thiosulfate sulfurtransferase, partial [Trifolium pratense]
SLGAKVVTIDVREANNLIQTGHIYLDVRTVQEFVKGPRVNTSKIINIPYMLDTPKGKVKNLYFLKECSSLCNIEDHLVVGCQFGLRSLHATSDLLDGGFKNVKNMDGGFAEWVSKMLPITNNSQVRP